MTPEEVYAQFQTLFSDIKDEEEFFNQTNLLLAHYTSLDALEKIIRSNEIWLSNPLFMNDFEEVRFGIMHGVSVFKTDATLRSVLETEDRLTAFYTALDYHLARFEREHLLDTYVFCLSKHEETDTDGMLSMWRGYGGNGRGAALVFDMSKVPVTDDTPLIIGTVHYSSEVERLNWLRAKVLEVAAILRENVVPTESLHVVAWSVLERLKLFALFTKHKGFAEEKEWRCVYLLERDSGNRLNTARHYLNGSRGVEPKLRFPFSPIDGVTASDFSLESVLHSIILGPTTSSPLAVRSVSRMLEVLGRNDLREKLVASTIPFRA